MRLLNTKTLGFQEFFDANIPDYAILSHCWGDDEVSYEKYLATPEDERVGTGWEKILKLCEIAGTIGLEFEAFDHKEHIYITKLRKLKWAWIDTCCIDKRSSAELSEAINSMYKWYNAAKVCLVFLPDVHEVSGQDSETMTDLQHHGNHATYSGDQMRGSRWFTRGWTLQELVAPVTVAFYNTSYQILGWKHDPSMLRLIQEITHINEDTLRNRVWSRSFPVAVRLSWASARETSRAEDIAYYLLSLCNINIPLLYDEGPKRAFQRLQLEIISHSTDDSIFAWRTPVSTANFLADSPKEFGTCSDDVYVGYEWMTSPGVVYTNTQRGIEFDVEIPRGLRPRKHWRYLCVPLRYPPKDGASMYVMLKEADNVINSFQYDRWHPFVVDRTSFSEADVWRHVLGWTKWSRGFIVNLMREKSLEKIQEQCFLYPLPMQDHLRRLWYKLYPAKKVHVCVPI